MLLWWRHVVVIAGLLWGVIGGRVKVELMVILLWNMQVHIPVKSTTDSSSK